MANFLFYFRPWYKETASTVLKDVVIVFDKSRSMQNSLTLAKDAVKAVLHALGPNDRVCGWEMWPISCSFYRDNNVPTLNCNLILFP